MVSLSHAKMDYDAIIVGAGHNAAMQVLRRLKKRKR